MSTAPQPARIHLLSAKEAPCVVVIRRKPANVIHVVRINTATDSVEHGSWFRGKLYAMRCDISFDGEWMVYLALGANGNSWNGVCRVPFLQTVVENENIGTWFGGGYWSERATLLLNQWSAGEHNIPFQVRAYTSRFGGEDLGVLYPRLLRDGWQKCGDSFGEDKEAPFNAEFPVRHVDDEGWIHQPTSDHPVLRTCYVGYKLRGWGYTFHFSLDGYSELIDKDVDWACWDCKGDLVFARLGVVYRYSLDDLKRGEPGAVFDLEPLVAPSRAK